MNCQELADFLLAYMEGDLPERQREEFERHMQCCPPCVAYLETYQKTIQLCQKSCNEAAEKPPKMPEQLVKAILAARGK